MKFSVLALTAMLVLLPSSILAQTQSEPYKFDPVDIQRKAATLMGGVHFVGQQCGFYTSAQMTEVKLKQSAHAVSVGLPSSEFETLYQQSHAATAQIWKTGTKEERQQACVEARQIM